MRPAQFAKNMLGTSVENMWGIVKMIVDKFMKEEVEEGRWWWRRSGSSSSSSS